MTRSQTTTGITLVAAVLVGWGAVGFGGAGCASSKAKSDEAADKSSKQKPAADQKKVRERAEGIPELEPLELRDEAPDAEKIDEKNDVSAYEIGDLTVLHKPTPANQVVSAKLYLDGGVANLSDSTAGIERLALKLAVNGGSESTPKDEFTSELDSMGSSISSFHERDFSGYELRSITKNFEASWELFVESVLEPAMPKEELAVQRKKQLAEIEQLTEDPNQYVGVVIRRMMARDSHPYRFLHLGTKENVESFGREDLLAYQRSLLDPSRMTLVLVGNVPTEELLEKVRSSLGRLEPGEWSPPELPQFEVGEHELEGREKSIPTNYIMGKFTAPSPEHEDYAALKVAMSYLSDRLFEEVRTKRNLSYAVSAGVTSRRSSTGYLYVSAKQPEETLQVMFDEVDKLKSEKLSEKELQRTRNVFITSHFKGLETNSNLASSLAQSALIEGDWRRHATFLERVKSVTPDQIHAVANEYMNKYRFALVGNPDSLDRSALAKMADGK